LAVAPAAARPRPGGGRLFIIVGVLLAALAFGGVFLLGNLGGGGAGLGGPSNTVVIAKQQIPLRHQITADDLELAKASVSGSDASLNNIYTSQSQVVGKIAEINISKGAMISSDMLATDLNAVPTGAAPAYLPLASGYVAITIPTGEQQGVAGHISLGDYITIIASAQVSIFAEASQKTVAQGSVSKTVFTGVRIIGLGPASSGVTSAAGNSSATTSQTGATTTGITSSLTIEMTQCDSEYMTWFLQNMTVKYTLESYKDYLGAPPSSPDASCPTVTAAGGVSPKQVDARYHFTTLVTGK
jgi:Flp pilus assembly protein CpaB